MGAVRPITERMAEAKARTLQLRRVPRVFFLGPADFDEFAATKPGTVEAMFALPLGHKPSLHTCLAFEGIAVRPTDRKPDKYGRIVGSLFACDGRAISVPRE